VLSVFRPVQIKGKALALGIAPLNEAQWPFSTVEVVADWHWL